MVNGKWLMENGDWKMENGEKVNRKIENSKMVNGKNG